MLTGIKLSNNSIKIEIKECIVNYKSIYMFILIYFVLHVSAFYVPHQVYQITKC
jgi:hypothetical protein